ncbi:MAG: ABC transporter ATP-binding protein/permease [Pseudobutyrivibrio sp.]|nr:ABC transporter ATP-binding protein/permease [Pseudobutyrivibrio sp.]
MSFIFKYVKKYKIRAILAPLFKMLEAIFELLVPLVMAAIINQGIGNSDKGYIIRMSGVLILLAVIGLGLALIAQYFSAYVAVHTASDIRMDLFNKILSLSKKVKDSVGEEVLTTRITNDINQIMNAVNMVLRLFLRSPFIVFGAMIMAAFVDAKASIIFILVVGLLALTVVFIMRFTLPRYKEIAARLEKVLGATSENLEGARVIRAFARTDSEKKEFKEKTQSLTDLQIITGKISALLNPLTYVMVNIGIVVLIYFSGIRVNRGAIMTGDVVALVNYMSQILIELVKLANLIVLIMKAIPSGDRVNALMEMKSDERTKGLGHEPGEFSGAIRMENVSFSYTGSMDFDLANISIDIPAGSVFGIIGGTGSGKTTLLRLLNHTFDATEGDVLLDGINVVDISDEKLSQVFGIVPQKASLFAGTIRSNMTMKNQASDVEIIEMLKNAQAYDFVMAKEGLDTEVLAKGNNFSGGQKQRLTIARALMGQPKVLVLDDSASALDLGTEAKLRSALSALPWKPTVIIVSQRASSVKSADQILVLEEGKCVGLGSHEKLLDSCQAYEEIYYCQYPKEEACNE